MSEASSTSTPRGRFSTQHLMLGIAAGVALSAVTAVLASVLLFRQPLPVLDEAALSSARQQWNTHGPSSYKIDIALGGSQSGQIHVEVRGREVVQMTRDGVVPRQRRTWDYWSIPNQFDMMRQDLDSAQSPQRAFGVSSPDQVDLRAKFDPQYGYPLVYRRMVSGSPHDVEWRITRFDVIDHR